MMPLPATFHMVFPFSFLLFYPLISFCTHFLPNSPFRLRPTAPTLSSCRPQADTAVAPPTSAPGPAGPSSATALPAPAPHLRTPTHFPSPPRPPPLPPPCPRTCAGLSPHLRRAGPRVPPAPHPGRLTQRSCTPPSRLCSASSGHGFALRRGGSHKDAYDLHVAKADSQMASQLPLYSL